jgi:hypothetical protein
MDIQEKSIMVKCDCSSEAIEVQYEPEYKLFYFAYWSQSFNRPLPFKERIRWMWHLLRTGNPWEDMVMISPEKAKDI